MGNACTSVWSDSYVINWSVQGNTIINSGTGISDEISPGSNIAGAGGPNDFSHNVLNNNSVECIHISASGGATVHDNNCSVPSGAHAIYSGIDNRGDAQIESNVSFYANTVTFLANGGEGYGSWSQCSVGQSSHNTSANGVSQCTTPFATGRSSGSTANHFYTSNSTADAHFAWVTAGDVGITYFTGLSFSAYQGRWGQDASSTIQVGNGGAAGCTTAWSQANPNVCPGGSGW